VGTISDFLGRHEFDYVLGAVHSLDHICLTSKNELESFKSEFLPRGPEKVVEHYFHDLRSAAGSQLFDCLAHFDIYRKYIQPLFDSRFTQAADSLLPSVLQFVAESGTGIEVNTSALRRGNAEPYPDKRILNLARDAGIRVFTIGSDAHRPADLGKDLDAAVRILGDLGVTPARFRRRKLVETS
jgi:histidinol-phosphatase (PHP family)